MNKVPIHIIPYVSGSETDDGKTITFDIVSSISPKRSRTISQSPISKGSFISELLSEKGGKVVMETYVSNNPVVAYPNNRIYSPDLEQRTHIAYSVLKALYDSRETSTIVHRFESLNSYFLTNFEPIIMPSDTIGFRLEFEEVRYASESRVNLLQNMSDNKSKEHAQKINAGQDSKASVAETSKEYEFMVQTILKDIVTTVTTTGE